MPNRIRGGTYTVYKLSKNEKSYLRQIVINTRNEYLRKNKYIFIESEIDDVDEKLLRTIIEKFRGGPVGLDTLAASIGEDRNTIEDVYEPYLLQLGFINRGPRGRIAMPMAYEHLNIEMPKK